MLEKYEFPEDFMNILEEIYTLPASVTVITQVLGWKYGKTDFALLLGELLSEKGIIDLVASNTKTDRFEFIEDFNNYDVWVRKRGNKLFLFDEVIDATQKRRAISGINIQWVKRIPQLSKGMCHLIVITQSQKLTESTFFNWTFLRGVWTKLSKTVVKFENPQLYDEPFIIEDIPRTTVKFEPYEFATFNEKGIVRLSSSPLTQNDQIRLDFKQGMRPYHLEKKYGIDHNTILNIIREGL